MSVGEIQSLIQPMSFTVTADVKKEFQLTHSGP
jgi:hypothetical protein